MKIHKKITFFYLVLMIVFALDIFADKVSQKQYSLLLIDSHSGEPYKSLRKSMISELSKLGYKEDLNLTIKYYSLANHIGRAKNIWGLIQKKKEKYDVIFLNGTIAAMAFRDLALDDENRFVFACVTNPVEIGIVEDFKNQPKHNFTGVCYPVKIEDRLRFIKKVFPNAKRIGLIYANMPPSPNYNKKIIEILKTPEFKDIEVIFREVEPVEGERGYIRMAMLAKKHIKELDSQVDLFVSPNDQMGVQPEFAKMVYATATKPLVGLGQKDVVDGWGAAVSIYPSLSEAGKRVAYMIKQLFENKSIKEIIPEWPPTGIAFDLKKAKYFGIDIPVDFKSESKVEKNKLIE